MSCEKQLLDNEEHPFRPGDPPRGSKNYDVKTLEPEQQEALDKIKLNLRQDNEVYLNNHPEIRGLVSIIIRLIIIIFIYDDNVRNKIERKTCSHFFRHLLDKEATSSQEIQSLLNKFFNRPRTNIAAELLEYFLEMNFKGPIVESLREETSESDHKREE